MILHFVTIKFRNEVVTTEHDPKMNFDQVVKNVWSGEFEDVHTVMQVDTEKGTAVDVTKQVAKAVCALSHEECREPFDSLEYFIEFYGFEPYRAPHHVGTFTEWCQRYCA